MTMTDVEPVTGSELMSLWSASRRATPKTVNFSKGPYLVQHASGKRMDLPESGDGRPRDPDGKLLTPKQIRARARRRMGHKKAATKGVITAQEFDMMYKPVEEWDTEELAHGRPRNKAGDFRGKAPAWVTREVHERAQEMFQKVVKSEMSALGTDALKTIQWVMTNTDEDPRGKPLVPATAKLQAASLLLEHIVGKPQQRVQQDISVKLQGILGAAIVNPMDLGSGDDNMPIPGYGLAHFPGQTLAIGLGDDPSDDDLNPSGE